MNTIRHLDNLGDKHRRRSFLYIALFLLIAISGLTYIKWWPYVHKAIVAINEHNIGSSIITGDASAVPAASWQAAWEYALTYYKAVWKAAVFGILLGSLLQVLLPSQWLLRVLGKATFKSTAIGGLASLPGMMCSCCAAPMAVGLRKQNVSIGAALAFWIGNPVLNPAVLVFMTFVLSWKFTLLRVLFGLILTLGVCYLANRFTTVNTSTQTSSIPLPNGFNETDSDLLIIRWLKTVWKMTLHIVPAYIIAVLLLGGLRGWMFPTIGETWSNSLLLLLFFAIIGTLFVIPTAAEIPIIQSLLSSGLGTGPASALLITLPAISLPSLLIVSKSFPTKVLLFVTASVIILGVICGVFGAVILP